MTKKVLDRLWDKSTDYEVPLLKRLTRLLRQLGAIHNDLHCESMVDFNNKIHQIRREKSLRMSKAQRRSESFNRGFTKIIKPTKSR